MSTTTTHKHPEARRALLKRARFSEGTELTEAKAKALDELPADAPIHVIEAIVKGDPAKSAQRSKPSKHPEAVMVAYRRAMELTGTPDEGGPKTPLTIKQTAAVRKAMKSKAKGDALEGNTALGKVSDSTLRKIAKGQDAPKGSVEAVRMFLKSHPSLKDDRKMYARKGAAIALAVREED